MATKKKINEIIKGNTAKIIVQKNGPYIVLGALPLDKESTIQDKEGIPISWTTIKQYPAKNNYLLCRCGESKNKPYCDATHARIKFDGTETASRKPFIKQAEEIKGPVLKLKDAQDLCAGTAFCHRDGGTWELVEKSDNPHAKKLAIETAGNCPSGRLVVFDKKTGKAIEPELQPSLSIVEEPAKGVSGPIWAKGGIKILSADNNEYETRNRVTLCRCGKSNNKPFCDGEHVPAGFKDE